MSQVTRCPIEEKLCLGTVTLNGTREHPCAAAEKLEPSAEDVGLLRQKRGLSAKGSGFLRDPSVHGAEDAGLCRRRRGS